MYHRYMYVLIQLANETHCGLPVETYGNHAINGIKITLYSIIDQCTNGNYRTELTR